MLICIDSCVFIRAADAPLSDAARLIRLLSPGLPVVIPRLVVREVLRNLRTDDAIHTFYRLFSGKSGGEIIDLPVPDDLVAAYVARGLRAKGDAYIGAFAEWMRVDCLISDNRHFLRDLQTDAYRLLSPGEFLELLTTEPKP
ncbi:MAG TPA: type II toxin-antitoxin system VapC family toxin [Promineifilum sp.]|nr:type II toxin-antitoxin system VapC family toxin [Promineifilum sp.]HRO90761.1 type II toxin-antitoxin system VapC family toxin [Promineifilum sp.]HRQ13830.1 type II toxin-antitoxin system VapC family toxin [Promineifilum sp.]